MPIRKHFADFIAVVLGAGFSRLFLFLASILIARSLGKSVFGQFSLFYVAYSIVPLFPLSFDTTYIRYAKNLAPGETKSEYLRINVCFKIIYFIAVLVLSIPLLFQGMSLAHAAKEQSALSLYSLGAIGGAALCFSASVASYYQEKGRFMLSSLVETSYCLLIFVILGAMHFTGLLVGLPQIFALYIMVAFATGIVSLIFLLRLSGPFYHFNRPQASTFLSLGKWVFLTSLVMYIFPRLDVMVLSNFATYANIGLYSAAGSMVMTLTLFSRSLNKVVLPKAMKEAIESPASFRKFSIEVMISSGLLLVLSIGLFILARPMINFVYGEGYAESASIFRILLLGFTASMLYTPYSFIFYALANPRFLFLLECFRFIIALVLLFILVPPYGLLGGAWSIAIAMMANASLSYCILRLKIARHFREQAHIVATSQCQPI